MCVAVALHAVFGSQGGAEFPLSYHSTLLARCKHMHEKSWVTHHKAEPIISCDISHGLVPCACNQVEAAALLEQLLPVKERLEAADAALLRVDPARSVTKAFRVRTGVPGASKSVMCTCPQDLLMPEMCRLVTRWSPTGAVPIDQLLTT